MFRDKLADMSDKIERLLERADQIDKLAAEIERFNGGSEAAEPANVSMFTIVGPSTNDPPNCSGGAPFPPSLAYEGILFDIAYNEADDCFIRVNQVQTIGYDFVTPNHPDQYPSSVSTLTDDLLDPFTTVMAIRVNDTAFFSSVMPRLSVECIE